MVDLNADGIDDLAVAAPTTGAFELQFRGAIHVYFGSGTGLPRQPDLVLSSGTDRDLLGTHLNSLDLDSDGHADLVVGSPYADGPNGHWRVGRVTAYLASQQVQRGTPPSPAWTLFGERVMDGFGTSTALIPGSPQRLVIGAPGVKWVIGAATAGAVYGYSLEDVRAPARVFSLLAQNRYGRFGAWLDVGDPGVGMVLAISAPSASSFDFRDTRHGEVFLVSVDELRGERLLDQIPIVTHFTGFAQLGRFGWRVHLRDLDGDGHDEALISEPKRPYGEVPGDKIPEVGVVYVWYGGDGFPRGRAEVGTAQWYSQPVRSRANRGTAMAFTSTPDGEQVYLASSRWSRYATLSGGVERIFPERPASAPAAARGEAPPSSSASNTGPPRRENPALPKR